MNARERLSKIESKLTPRRVIGVTWPEEPDLVTVDGATMSRADFSRAYPGGLLLQVVYRDTEPAAVDGVAL